MHNENAIVDSGKNCFSLLPLAIVTVLYLNPSPQWQLQHQAQTSKDLAEEEGTEVSGQFLPFTGSPEELPTLAQEQFCPRADCRKRCFKQF